MQALEGVAEEIQAPDIQFVLIAEEGADIGPDSVQVDLPEFFFQHGVNKLIRERLFVRTKFKSVCIETTEKLYFLCRYVSAFDGKDGEV